MSAHGPMAADTAADDKARALDHYAGLAAQALGHSVDPLGATLGRFVPLPVPPGLQTLRPHVGRHHGRLFRSLGDVMAYEAGYLTYALGHTAGLPSGTPFAAGWADASVDAAQHAMAAAGGAPRAKSGAAS